MYKRSSEKPICPCEREKVVNDAFMNKKEAAKAYQRQANKKPHINQYQQGERVLVKRNNGPNPKINVKWVDGPYFIDRKVGPVNWAVRDSKGKTKVLHHDLIKKAGIKSDALHTPSEPWKDPEDKSQQLPVIHVSLSPTNGVTPGLSDSLDRAAFSNRVFDAGASQVATRSTDLPNINIVTRSGRTSRPVIGSRLVDQNL